MENAAYHMNYCGVSKAAVPRWCLRGQCGFIHKVFHGYQSSASLDEGGDMSAGRYFVSGGGWARFLAAAGAWVRR